MFWPFALIVVLQAVVILVCLCGKVSSGSFYSAVLADLMKEVRNRLAYFILSPKWLD